MEYPFTNQDMIYDYEQHRYILTADCVSRNLGIDLSQGGNVEGSTNASAFANQTLNRISRMVYNYIYEAVQNTQLWSCLLAKTPSCRDKLKNMMLAQVEYLSTGGYTAQQSGINLSTSSVIDLNALRGAAKVADEVEQICTQLVAEWGVCMRYSGTLRLYNNIMQGGAW